MCLFSVLRCSDDLLTNPGSAIIGERLFLFNFPVLLLTPDGSANCSRGSKKRPARKGPTGKITPWLCPWTLHQCALQCTVFLLVIINLLLYYLCVLLCQKADPVIVDYTVMVAAGAPRASITILA